MQQWVLIALVATAVAGCQSTAGPGQSEALYGTWRVERIGERPVMDNSPARIRLDREGRVSGNASCNRYFGAYRLEGETLIVEPLMGSTKMQCPPALMEQEARFLDALPGRYQWSLKGGLLRLYGAGGETAFRAARVE